ncbi:uncharacterized protein PAC_10730 [Phialocephala subalpina]|uniref:Uncharacterized protein n=1 Tax=Phialocephala subalpina TaxID=576137 RepID=A0A1L7X735_9HELO|nr:uncharacterized protein PAC_10730 [Phialocephala subalpina]
MKFSVATPDLFVATALAASGCIAARQEAGAVFDRGVNNGRPVATGACCIANTSKKGDTCTQSNGAAGICSVANTAGCKTYLKASENRMLTFGVMGGARLTCT